MKGIDVLVPDSLLITRAREALAEGALDAATLMERVCSLPSAPRRVAERLAEALFSRHADFGRDESGRWCLLHDREVQRASFVDESPDTGDAADEHRDGPVLSALASSESLASGRNSALRDAGQRPRATVRSRREGARGIDEEDVLLRDLRFAVVDVETTGTSPSLRDRVTEIAIVHVEGGAVTSCYETLVNPDRPIPPAIVALTRITQEMVAGAPRFPLVASEVVGNLRARIFVAHNASFDWRFVSHEVQRAAGVVLTGETLCTVRLARVLLPQLPRRSLDAVTHYFGIDIGARHRAAGDALATAHVLVRLLHLAEEQGAHTWRDLSALLQRKTSRATRRRSAMPRGVDIDPTL